MGDRQHRQASAAVILDAVVASAQKYGQSTVKTIIISSRASAPTVPSSRPSRSTGQRAPPHR